MAHSPAPWTWHHEPGAYPNLPFINDATGKEVMSFGHDTDSYQSSGEAPNPDDAALICAAPELLEACKAIMYVAAFTEEAITQEQDDKIRAAFGLVKAAIAKATNPIQANQSDADILSRQIVAEEYHCGKCGRLLTDGKSHNCTNPIQTT